MFTQSFFLSSERAYLVLIVSSAKDRTWHRLGGTLREAEQKVAANRSGARNSVGWRQMQRPGVRKPVGRDSGPGLRCLGGSEPQGGPSIEALFQGKGQPHSMGLGRVQKEAPQR